MARKLRKPRLGLQHDVMNSTASKPNTTARRGLILVALATGFSIVALAYVSKRVLVEPMRPAFFAIPPLLMSAYEYLAHRRKGRFISSPAFWVVSIVVVTALVILLHWM